MCSDVLTRILTLCVLVGDGAECVGVCTVLEDDVFTPAAVGAPFLSPLPTGATEGVTF